MIRKLIDIVTIVVFIILLIGVFTAEKPTQKEIINASVQAYGK